MVGEPPAVCTRHNRRGLLGRPYAPAPLPLIAEDRFVLSVLLGGVAADPLEAGWPFDPGERPRSLLDREGCRREVACWEEALAFRRQSSLKLRRLSVEVVVRKVSAPVVFWVAVVTRETAPVF